MLKTKILKKLAFCVSVSCVVTLMTFSQNLHHGTLAIAEADELNRDAAYQTSYPLTKTFTISAYYSPLPCQNRYATGSYESDIRLNGRGTNGADGTPVYAGMVAAPKTYAFGTKMYIPGIGIVAVHDRGGAIVNAGERSQMHDRLDVWMGYGDKGLQRALSWGKRNIDVTVYGNTDSVVEDVNIFGYAESEKTQNSCTYDDGSDTPQIIQPGEINDGPTLASVTLALGSSGDAVKKLQEELISLNFLKTEVTGIYDEVTEHAVYKFQQSQNIIASKTDTGAGVFGPKTRGRVNEIIGERVHVLAMVEEATEKSGRAIANDSDESQYASYK